MFEKLPEKEDKKCGEFHRYKMRNFKERGTAKGGKVLIIQEKKNLQAKKKVSHSRKPKGNRCHENYLKFN